MSLSTNFKVETKDDNIYYQVNIVNNETFSQFASFSQRLTNSIIDNANDYYMAVSKFSLNSADAPIFLWKDNFWYVSLSYPSGDPTAPYVGSAPVLYGGLSPPVAAYGPYGPAVYNYQQFIQSVNNAYGVALTTLAGLVPGGLVGVEPPFFTYDATNSGILSVFAQSAYYDIIANPSTSVSVWVNHDLYKKFQPFWINYYAELGDMSDHLDINIITTVLPGATNTSTINPSIPTGYLKMTQDGPNCIAWWDWQSIVFKSYTMGLRNQYVTAVNAAAQIGMTNNNYSGNGIPQDNVLVTFNPDFGEGSQQCWRQQLNYFPQFYKLIDLLGEKNQKSVDIQIWLQDYLGNQYPFLIQGGKNCTLELVFVKKSLYKNYMQQGDNPYSANNRK